MSNRNVAQISAVAVLVLLAGGSAAQAQVCPFTVTGALAPGDLTTNPRLFRDDPGSTCAVPTACATSGAAAFAVDIYTFTTPPGPNPACTTVTLNTACIGLQFIHSGAFLGTFVPPIVCNASFLGDIGASPDGVNPKSYSFNVPPATTFSVIVTEVTAGQGCASYTLDVTGCETTPVELLHFSVE